MRWLIRRVLKRANGDVFEDDIHFGDTLGVGRGTDQAVYITDLRAALAHARVTALGGGRYRVESLIAAGVRVDGASQMNATVKAGSHLDIGGVFEATGNIYSKAFGTFWIVALVLLVPVAVLQLIFNSGGAAACGSAWWAQPPCQQSSRTQMSAITIALDV